MILGMKGTLRLVWAALWATPVLTMVTDGAKAKATPASMDEVNVLMYGVLQFSESLHSTYESTDSKMGRIAATLLRQQGVLERLESDADEASITEERIRHTLDKLQTQMAGLQSQMAQLNRTLKKVEQEEAELQNQVKGLEKNLESSGPGKIRQLKELTLQNSAVLKALVKWIQDHRQSLENQNQQLTQLQETIQGPGLSPLL